ncbi:carbohydrate kinase family protein [Ectothiorhodospira shaposhnikovii]|uniref:carbohydrate kinase family protein n=1 Tax=Ectothiorhodospira shaposhnikovii TaxID=1054 RepID=UPI001EE93C46|nr:carbohydrate kinase [Ectothiorhodospira shaposhnikovii]
MIFGEVLFDCFEDRSILGGAPFNVAWNLRGLGADPLFVGAVGDDELGRRVMQALNHWDMRPEGLQMDPGHPTGQVRVTLKGGEPRYDILPDQAYDHIDTALALAAAPARAGVLYHGSLALRDPVSRQALEALREQLSVPVFMDVNLRAPWWDRDTVQGWMAHAHWVKLNQDELTALSPAPDEPDLVVQARLTLERYGLSAVIVTRASEGAMVLTREGELHQRSAPPVTGLVDTVGAGDAFSAVTLTGILRGWDWETILTRAADFAAKVCTLHGATTEDRGFYQSSRQDW